MLDLNSLNPQQREAVTTTEGPLLVLAGAGSGKTRVITFRLAYLLERGVPADRLLALSFTNKAAGEMKERIRGMVGRQADGAILSTFHALGMRFLREEAESLGLAKGFTILDEADQIDAIRRALVQLGFDQARFEPKLIHARIGHYKSLLLQPDPRAGGVDAVTAHVYPLYEQRLRAMNAVDFDDLIGLPVKALTEHADIAMKWAWRFKYIMVDEYQDTNGAQLRLVKALCSMHKNICAVGDDDQSIYAWRGAVAGNILKFSEHFEGAKLIFLTQNYRSTNNVLRAANSVIANNPERHEKNLWSANGDGPLIRLRKSPDGDDEASWIANDLQTLRRMEDLSWRDIAILYRTNAQSRQLEDAIRLARVPYRIIGGTKFYDRKEVRDIVSYLRVIHNPFDDAAYRRILNYPVRGIGDGTIEKIAQTAKEDEVPFWRVVEDPSHTGIRPNLQEKLRKFHEFICDFRTKFTNGSMAEACRELIRAVGFADELCRTYKDPRQVQRRLENIEEVASALKYIEEKNPEATLFDYLSQLSLDTHNDSASPGDTDEVSLMTIHGSKGLEFKAVYLAGLEEGFMPHRRVLEGDGSVAEERRLAYVALTRAKKHLILTCAEKRLRFGRIERRKVSRFLTEITPTLLTGAQQVRTAEEKQAFAMNAFAAMKAALNRPDPIKQ